MKITVTYCLPSVGVPEDGGDDPVGVPKGGVDDPRRFVLLPPQLSLVVAGNLCEEKNVIKTHEKNSLMRKKRA